MLYIIYVYIYIYIYMYIYLKLEFECSSRKRERKKTGVINQAKNLAKLTYIKRSSHEIYINCSSIINF